MLVILILLKSTPEEGVEVEVPSNTKVIVKGINKERVGASSS